MFNIINIECKNNKYVGNSIADRENTFYGQAVMDKDGYFEGLVTVSYSGIHIERFIFGVCRDESVSLYKFEPTNKDIITKYDSYSMEESLIGSFCVSSSEEVLATGDISMVVSPGQQNELTQSVADDIMYRIDNWKRAFFDDNKNRLYEKLALDVMREKDNSKVFEKK